MLNLLAKITALADNNTFFYVMIALLVVTICLLLVVIALVVSRKKSDQPGVKATSAPRSDFAGSFENVMSVSEDEIVAVISAAVAAIAPDGMEYSVKEVSSGGTNLSLNTNRQGKNSRYSVWKSASVHDGTRPF